MGESRTGEESMTVRWDRAGRWGSRGGPESRSAGEQTVSHTATWRSRVLGRGTGGANTLRLK